MRIKISFSFVALLVCIGLAFPGGAQSNSSNAAYHSSTPMTITVSVVNAPRQIFHADMTIPVQPGDLTLVYAKWIPGEHAPSGPVVNLAGLTIEANGKTLPWVRDNVNMYAFHVHVPDGVSVLHVHDDYLSTSAGKFSSGASTAQNLAVVNWNEEILWPEVPTAKDIQVTPSLILPAGWKYGTALTKTGGEGGTIHFATVPLNQLIDSPVLTGLYFRQIALAPDISPKHYLDIAADGPEDLNLSPQTIAAFNNLVREAAALYKSHHYHSYHFLLTLSDYAAHFGLEHHQSSDDRVGARTFLDPNMELRSALLLPHEFTHSWNGKYRRPEGLLSPDYQKPMVDNMLWVYEGLTEYLGDVLTARSGLWTDQQYRDALADTAAAMNHWPGRTWRDFQDVNTDAQDLYNASTAWSNWRRGTDFYPEGELLWLDVDTIIRQQSQGKKSLNDFCASFLGLGGNTGPITVPYSFDDLVKALNAVQPYDWAAFFKKHLTTKVGHAPLGGITRGGYKIVYTDKPNSDTEAAQNLGLMDAWYSIGLVAKKDGTIGDVLHSSLAFKAGLGPGMKIVAVDGRTYTNELMQNAIRDSKISRQPILLIVVNIGYYRTVNIDYHGGLQYPHLERVNSKPDLLDKILKPLAKHPKS